MLRMSAERPKYGQVSRLVKAWDPELSQTDLGAMLGVSQALASKWLGEVSEMRPVYWVVLRCIVAADLGVFAWPPPSFDELMKLLKGRR